MRIITLVLTLSAGAALAAACGGSSPSIFGADPDAGTSPDTGPGSAVDDSGAPVINPDAGPVQQVDAAPPPPVTVVYAHSPDKLYRLDPTTKKVTLIGPFDGCSSVIDLAIDANSSAFVTTFGGFYSLDLKTAKCTEIATGSYPNSLSFVPKGTLDPNQEALVGYNGSTYVRIDVKTGKVSTVGTLSGGYASSGDIVSVINGGTFLTVTSQTCGDCLIQVDPKSGGLVKAYGSVGHGAVYGLAFWAGTLYGFDNAGQLFEITPNGNGIQTKDIPLAAGLQWWGAGSSTSAPVANADGGVIPIN